MKNKSLDQSVGSTSAPDAPVAQATFLKWLLLILGLPVGLLPLGCAVLFATSQVQFLNESWVALASVIFMAELLITIVWRVVSLKRGVQALTKGIIWGLVITTGVAIFKLLSIAYYILTF